MLAEWLGVHRPTVLIGLVDLCHDQPNWRLVGSPLITCASSLRALVAGSAAVEIPEGGDPAPAEPDHHPDAESQVLPVMGLASWLGGHGSGCLSRQAGICALGLRRHDSGAAADPFDGPGVTVHLIEESARHNGHLDILRELLDGVTGY